MSSKINTMNKKDLIKHIAESLEKTLPKDLDYSLPAINTLAEYIVKLLLKVMLVQLEKKKLDRQIELLEKYEEQLGEVLFE